MPEFDAGDLVSQRMAALLVLDRRLPSPSPVWIGEHLAPFLPPRTAAVAQKVAAGVRKNRRRTGFALANIRQSLVAEQRKQHNTDPSARLERSTEVWSSADSREVQDWFRAIGAVDRIWLVEAQMTMTDLAPALLPLLGIFYAPLPPGVTAFMLAPPALAARITAVEAALFNHLSPAHPVRPLLRRWITALDLPTLARAVTCALVLVDAGTVTIRTCNLTDAAETMDQRIQPGQRHLLVQACRWRQQDPRPASQPGRRAQLYGGYVTRSFGTIPLLDRCEEPRPHPKTGKLILAGPLPHIIDQLTQVDLLARHTQQYALHDQNGVQTDTVVPTPRWLFEESHTDRITAEASGSRILAAQTRWVAKVVPKADQPRNCPEWAPATATLVAYHQAGVMLVGDRRTPRRKGHARQVVTGAVAVRDLLARSRCELVLADDLQAVALFDYNPDTTDRKKMQQRKSRAKP